MSSRDDLISAWSQQVVLPPRAVAGVSPSRKPREGRPKEKRLIMTGMTLQGSRHQTYYIDAPPLGAASTPHRRSSLPSLNAAASRVGQSPLPRRGSAPLAVDRLELGHRTRRISSLDCVRTDDLSAQRVEEMIPSLLWELYQARRLREEKQLEYCYLQDQLDLVRRELHACRETYDQRLTSSVQKVRRENEIEVLLASERRREGRLHRLTTESNERLRRREAEQQLLLGQELRRCVDAGGTAVYANLSGFNIEGYRRKIDALRREKKKLERAVKAETGSHTKVSPPPVAETQHRLEEEVERTSRAVEALKEKCVRIQGNKKRLLARLKGEGAAPQQAHAPSHEENKGATREVVTFLLEDSAPKEQNEEAVFLTEGAVDKYL